MVATARSIGAGADAPEFREDIRIPSLVPVPEAWPDEAHRRRPRGALQHVVLAVEEVCRIPRVPRNVRFESRERPEEALGPFPAVADQFMHPPGADAICMRADGVRGPAHEIEVAVSS